MEFPAPPFRGALAFADLIIPSVRHESCDNITCLPSTRTSGPCAHRIAINLESRSVPLDVIKHQLRTLLPAILSMTTLPTRNLSDKELRLPSQHIHHSGSYSSIIRPRIPLFITDTTQIEPHIHDTRESFRSSTRFVLSFSEPLCVHGESSSTAAKEPKKPQRLCSFHPLARQALAFLGYRSTTSAKLPS
jgi:hypothetical protein